MNQSTSPLRQAQGDSEAVFPRLSREQQQTTQQHVCVVSSEAHSEDNTHNNEGAREKLYDLGLRPRERCEYLVDRFGEDRVLAVIAYVGRSFARNPAGMARMALEEEWVIPHAKPKPTFAPPPTKEAVAASAKERYMALDEADRESVRRRLMSMYDASDHVGRQVRAGLADPSVWQAVGPVLDALDL